MTNMSYLYILQMKLFFVAKNRKLWNISEDNGANAVAIYYVSMW